MRWLSLLTPFGKVLIVVTAAIAISLVFTKSTALVLALVFVGLVWIFVLNSYVRGGLGKAADDADHGPPY